VRIPAYDEPEPDVSVVRGIPEDYRQRHPGPGEVGLVVEVSLTTLDLDRGQKLSDYATHGIPVYWIINLVDLQIEVYTGPGAGGLPIARRLQARPGRAHRHRRPASRRHRGQRHPTLRSSPVDPRACLAERRPILLSFMKIR
jgi:hypothetical protein